MRKLAFFGATALILASLNGLIIQKESLKASGQTVFLSLTPVDPRSLMMGDYMSLNYEISDKASGSAKGSGLVIIKLDDKKIGTFAGVDSGAALKPDERLMRFRERYGRIQIGPSAFYFQEGLANQYSKAKFGELRVTPSGECLLVGLCDENLARLGPKK